MKEQRIRSVDTRPLREIACRYRRALSALPALVLLAACGGGGSGGDQSVTVITPPFGATGTGIKPDLAASSSTFRSDHFVGSGVCSDCHNDESMVVATPVGDKNVSIGKAWESSTMANATRDPYWHAVVAYELEKFPNLEEEINDTCTRCHAPMANEYAKKEGIKLQLFDKGSEEEGTFEQGLYSMDSSNTLFDHAMDGVSCTLCHQMDAGNLGTEESMTGGFVINDYRGLDIKDRPAYGQYQQPDGVYMREQSDFNAVYGAHISTSETCATCHNLNVDPVDENGELVAGAEHFAEQAMYTEWLLSDFRTGGIKEQTCQGCHMPEVAFPVKLAQGSSNEPRPGFREHTFLGANTVMQSMMSEFSSELGISEDIDFESSIALNREFLKTAADIDITGGAVADGTLSFDVNILNQSGHRLPSGYHSRRVYLHVQVLDADGEQVFESGKINQDGSIDGVSEDANPDSWEVHYDVITSETQVQVYQAIVSDNEGERTHSLLRGTGYLKDNRITPQGMNKFSIIDDPALPSSFGVFGAAVTDDDFNDGRDSVSYKVKVPAGGNFRVLAELRYQPLSYGHLRDLFTESAEIEQVDMFQTIYDATERHDEVIDAVSVTIP